MSQLNDLLMPKLGLTMTEGMLIEWSVTSGAEVKAGDSLFVVETDKVANEIVAQADGTLAEPGTDSPWRDRPADESLLRLREMRD
ncbi:biotin/lipoyl-containing protein, partial [Bordetella bronchiseptica]